MSFYKKNPFLELLETPATTISSPPEQDQRGSPRSQQQLSSIVHPSSSARLCGAASIHNAQIMHRSWQPVPDL